MVQPFERSRWLSAYPPSAVDDAMALDRQGAHDTQVATQMLRSEGDYLGERPDIGRPVGPGVRELFVSCDAGEAMQQQFDVLRPEFVAVHDLACNTSRKLLAGIAAACNRAVQRLVIRRQGYGTILAAIEFVDCPAHDGSTVRLYSTDAESDSASRQAIARVMLGYAAMGVVMVGDLPAHALADQLAPLRQQMGDGWQCSLLQLMPLFPMPTLAAHAADLGVGAGVQVQVTAQVTRPADAWTFLSQAWNMHQGVLHPDGSGPQLGRLGGTPAPGPVPMPPLPAARGPVAAPASRSAPAVPPLERFIRAVAQLPGVTACCVFEAQTSRLLAHSGQQPAPSDLARRGTALLAAATSSRKLLALHGATDEVLIMGGGTGLAVRMLSSQPELALHVAFQPARADWPALRPKIMALDATLEPGAFR